MTTESLKGIVHSDPDIMGGTPVFVGTRVPLQNLSRALTGHYCVSVQRQGWSGVKNGDLPIVAARRQFDFAAIDLPARNGPNPPTLKRDT